mmetsp:Transcript_98037/g.171179  ORF Transcript_98037/g.171179 Transcript_98037/m.171179 type:complete len:146 (-) Transcript_98037:188-625(-)
MGVPRDSLDCTEALDRGVAGVIGEEDLDLPLESLSDSKAEPDGKKGCDGAAAGDEDRARTAGPGAEDDGCFLEKNCCCCCCMPRLTFRLVFCSASVEASLLEPHPAGNLLLTGRLLGGAQIRDAGMVSLKAFTVSPACFAIHIRG